MAMQRIAETEDAARGEDTPAERQGREGARTR